MVASWINAIDHMARFNLAAIRQPTIKTLLIRLTYGTLLSDRFFIHVYPRLAAALAGVLALLPASVARKQLRDVGFLDPVRVPVASGQRNAPAVVG